MRTKIEVFKPVEKVFHSWRKYQATSQTMDKYMLYYKNIPTPVPAVEVYEDLVPLTEGAYLYRKCLAANQNIYQYWQSREVDSYYASESRYGGYRWWTKAEYEEYNNTHSTPLILQSVGYSYATERWAGDWDIHTEIWVNQNDYSRLSSHYQDRRYNFSTDGYYIDNNGTMEYVNWDYSAGDNYKWYLVGFDSQTPSIEWNGETLYHVYGVAVEQIAPLQVFASASGGTTFDCIYQGRGPLVDYYNCYYPLNLYWIDRTNYTWGYATETEFNTYQPDKWKWWIKSYFPAGYYVPNKNWPQMLFTDKAFRNIRTDLASGYTFADDAYSIGNVYNIYFENPEANKTFNRLNCQNFKMLWDNVISPIETEYGEDECNTDWRLYDTKPASYTEILTLLSGIQASIVWEDILERVGTYYALGTLFIQRWDAFGLMDDYRKGLTPKLGYYGETVYAPRPSTIDVYAGAMPEYNNGVVYYANEVKLDELIPQIHPDQAGLKFYRYVTDAPIYDDGFKAGYIYLPTGTDIEETYNLTPYGSGPSMIADVDAFGYSYEARGTETVWTHSGTFEIVNDADFTAYPKNGYKDGYYYEYAGTNEVDVDVVWDETVLRGNANYNFEICNSDFTFGGVFGKSFNVDINGNVKEFIPYFGRKCRLYYTYEDDINYTPIGYFTITNITYTEFQITTIEADDVIAKLDANVYEAFADFNYPLKNKGAIAAIGDYLQIPYYSMDDYATSEDFMIVGYGDIKPDTTGRDFMESVAQSVGGYVYADDNGFLKVGYYKKIRDNLSQDFITYYDNLKGLGNVGTTINSIELGDQTSQKIEALPIQVVDSVFFNKDQNTKYISKPFGTTNVMMDVSDNLFLQESISQNVLDQYGYSVLCGFRFDEPFYGGDVAMLRHNPQLLGTIAEIRIMDDSEYRRILPTSVSISSSGVNYTSKGTGRYPIAK